MARGFSAGLIHGAAVGMIALAGLSVAFPPVLVPPASDGKSSESLSVTPPETPRTPEPAQPEQHQAPRAEILDTPTGSEFGRATDLQPVAPAPLAPVSPPQGGPTAAVAPASESLPQAVTAPAERPATGSDSPAAPSVMAISTTLNDLPDMPIDDQAGAGPEQGVMPGRFIPDGPDSNPQQEFAPALAPSADAQQPDLMGLPDLAALSDPLILPQDGAVRASDEQGGPNPDHVAPAAPQPSSSRDLGMPAPDLSLPSPTGLDLP